MMASCRKLIVPASRTTTEIVRFGRSHDFVAIKISNATNPLLSSHRPSNAAVPPCLELWLTLSNE